MTNYPQQFYPQQETKIDYMKMVLQGLAALLLISLITLAWSVRSWLLSRTEQNLAEQQAPPAATLNTTVRAEVQQPPPTPPPAQPQVADQQPAPAPQKEPAAEPQMAPAPAPAPQLEARADGGVASSVDQALTSLQQQSALRQSLAGSTETPDLSAAKPATKEDAAYVNALSAQYQDRGQPREQVSDEELAKRINAGTRLQAAPGKVIDTTNKVLIPAGGTERGSQGELDALVAASLQTISEGTATAAPQTSYIQGLQQEAAIRENEARTVVVKSGDTLTALSARAYGSANQYMKIFHANPTLITNPNRIFIGQVLRVPL
ncbi:MAG: LysM peptidoglycan-binding domain-containing protein [Gammaproteobacteria bacterium]|nr:LysM peptidoglycan-binding domain-containing protein [Gammaproteobacteria bacterium]MBU1654375.1 LysM peptidoglycan-binding domain-containing protein [Gammaproteobacteria bacterium]MBU1962002.1 LysM peptidoglycan-binding domain-containing protein [Gammaproteobacteria bacterium]